MEVRLGGPDPVTLPGEVDESVVEPTKWILAFHLALISGRDTSLIDSLCETPSSRLRQSSTTNPMYRCHWVDALQGFWSGASDTARRIIATMEATDPDREDIAAPNWVLNIDVPLIQLFFYALDRDERFGEALANGLQLHKKYWTSGAQRRKDWDGWVSFGLTSMAVLGKDRGLKFDVESEYLLMNCLV